MRIGAGGLALLLAACGTGSPQGQSSAGPSGATTGPSGTAGSASSASASTPAVKPLPETAVVRIPVSTGPNTIAISSDRIWVEVHRDDTLASIDPTTFEVTRHSDIPVHCAIASAGGDAVWTTIAKQNRITKVDAGTGEATATAELRDACGVSAIGDQVWVTSPGASTIVRLDPETAVELRTIDVPGMPFMVNTTGDVVYASGEGGGGWLRAFDPESGAQIAERTGTPRITIDQLAFGFDSAWGTGRVWHSLIRYDPATLDVQGSVRIGLEPSGVAATDDAIWVTQLDGTLVRVDPSTMTATDAWSLDAEWVAWPVLGFGRMWVSALEDDAILGIDLSALGA